MKSSCLRSHDTRKQPLAVASCQAAPEPACGEMTADCIAGGAASDCQDNHRAGNDCKGNHRYGRVCHGNYILAWLLAQLLVLQRLEA